MTETVSACEAVQWAFGWCRSGRLPRTERQLLHTLASHAPNIYPSNAELCALMGVSEETLKPALTALEARGLIVRPRNDSGQLVKRSRARQITLLYDVVPVAVAAEQMQFDLGPAVVAADSAPRPTRPATDGGDEYAHRRARFAEQAREIAAHPAILHRGEDSTHPNSAPDGVEPFHPGSATEAQEETEGERGRASAPTQQDTQVTNSPALSPTLTAVADVLRRGFAPAVVDTCLPSIDAALAAYPEVKGHDHVSAACVVVSWQLEGDMRTGSPARLLMSALRKQHQQPTPSRAPASRRRGDVGHQAPAKPKRFVKQSSVEDPIFG